MIPAGQEARVVGDDWPATWLPREQIESRSLEVFSTSPGPRRSGLRVLLDWLEGLPGQTWQQRWRAGGADAALRHWPTIAYFGWTHVLFGTAAAFCLGALYAGHRLLLQPSTGRGTMPFGPFMVVGTYALLLASGIR